MSDQPAPPPPVLSEKFDADAIRVLDAILSSPASEIKERVAEAKAFFGVRIAGDLRPRVLAGQTAIAERDAALRDLQATSAALATAQADLKALSTREKAAVEAQTRLKKAMTDKGIKLP